MRPFLMLYDQTLTHLGVKKEKDFILSLFILIVICALSSFTQTFINLDIYQLKILGDLMSIDFAMPFLGGLVAILMFPMILEVSSLKHLLIGSLIGVAFGYFLLIFLEATEFNVLLRFFLGFFYSIIFLVLYCYQANIYNTRYRATLFSFSGLMMAVFSAFGTSLNDFVGTIPYVFGIGIFGILLCVWAGLKIGDEKSRDEETLRKESLSSQLSSCQVFFKAPLIFLIIFMGGVAMSSFPTYFPIFGEGLGLNPGHASLLFSFAQMGSIFLILLGGVLADKIGYEMSLFLMMFLALVGTGVSFFIQNIWVVGCLFFLVRGGIAAFFSITVAWVARDYTRRNLSKGMAGLVLARRLGGVLSPLGVGFMMQHFGNRGFIIWIFMGLLSVCGLLVVSIFKDATFIHNENS